MGEEIWARKGEEREKRILGRVWSGIYSVYCVTAAKF